MSKKRGASIIILIAVVIFVLISSSYLMRLMTPETRQYSYSEILYMFEDQQVSGYELDLGSNEVVLKMADGSPDVVYRVAAPSYFWIRSSRMYKSIMRTIRMTGWSLTGSRQPTIPGCGAWCPTF